MPTYAYQAINERGETLKGVVEADSSDAAMELLSGRGMLPSRLQERSRPRQRRSSVQISRRWLRRIPTADLILFTKQFSTLFRAGVPMMSMLDILAAQTENARLKTVVTAMRQAIKEGARLYETFRQHPGVF